MVSSIASSPASFSTSPIGPLTDAGSRKTLIYLILTLNHVFPDDDFSALRSHHFSKQEGLSACRVAVAALLLEPARLFGAAAQAPELDTLWARLEEVIQPSECDVYSYKADTEGDPFNDSASLWSFCYFFFNRKLKRIVCFTCLASSKRAGGDAERGDDDDEDGDFFAMEYDY